MGHSSCGAVHATMEGKAVPGQISTLYRSIRPAMAVGGDDMAAVVKANARIQAELLRDSSPVLHELVKTGKLKVLPAYYELATGQVTLLD
jgi:carbonic anhydrase